MDRELKKKLDRIAEIETSDLMKELTMLKKAVAAKKAPISKAIKLSAKDNGTAITRFMHKPDGMVVSVRSDIRAKGFITWEGQAWDWGLSLRAPNPQIQKVVTLSARF